MLNVNTLTNTLSRMELPQLQQYAALHKNDPYVVALALSIANQKKQMNAAKQGQAGMMPQPKVVDQAIAQMAAPQQALPEDVGIGQLPAQNMQRMAGGGIVAFEEGGDVPGYADGVFTGTLGNVPSGAIVMGNMYQDPVTGKMIPIPQKDALPFGNVPMNYAENKRLYEAKKQAALAERTKAAQTIINESPEDYAARKVAELEALGGKKLSPDARNMAMSQFVKDKIAGQVRRGEANFIKDSALAPPKTTYTGDPTKPLPGMPIPGKPPLGAPPAEGKSADDEYISGINKLIGSTRTASAVGPISQLDAKRYSFTPAEMANITPKDFADALTSAMPANPTASPFDEQQKALNAANVATRQNAKAEMEKQFKEQGLAFQDTLDRLTKKEKRVQTMEDNQLGLSLLEAGLNMMAGESQYAMVNIGKGAQAGTKKYMELQNQIEAYRDKIDDTKMKIEEYRRNEANMNARELRAAQRDIDDAVSNGAQAMINIAREQYGLNRNQAISFVSNSMQMQQFNVNAKNQAAIHNQSTAAGIDTAYAQMANARAIADKQMNTHLGLAALEAKYRADNPTAGSYGFYKKIGGGDPVKGMKIYSENMGPEAKGDEALLLSWAKMSEIEKNIARKTDPIGSAQKDQLLQKRLLAGSVKDAPSGNVLDQPK